MYNFFITTIMTDIIVIAFHVYEFYTLSKILQII